MESDEALLADRLQKAEARVQALTAALNELLEQHAASLLPPDSLSPSQCNPSLLNLLSNLHSALTSSTSSLTPSFNTAVTSGDNTSQLLSILSSLTQENDHLYTLLSTSSFQEMQAKLQHAVQESIDKDNLLQEYKQLVKELEQEAEEHYTALIKERKHEAQQLASTSMATIASEARKDDRSSRRRDRSADRDRHRDRDRDRERDREYEREKERRRADRHGSASTSATSRSNHRHKERERDSRRHSHSHSQSVSGSRREEEDHPTKSPSRSPVVASSAFTRRDRSPVQRSPEVKALPTGPKSMLPPHSPSTEKSQRPLKTATATIEESSEGPSVKPAPALSRTNGTEASNKDGKKREQREASGSGSGNRLFSAALSSSSVSTSTAAARRRSSGGVVPSASETREKQSRSSRTIVEEPETVDLEDRKGSSRRSRHEEEDDRDRAKRTKMDKDRDTTTSTRTRDDDRDEPSRAGFSIKGRSSRSSRDH